MVDQIRLFICLGLLLSGILRLCLCSDINEPYRLIHVINIPVESDRDPGLGTDAFFESNDFTSCQ